MSRRRANDGIIAPGGTPGTPRRRPAIEPETPESVYAVVLEQRKLTIKHGSGARELTLEEALELETFNKAFKDSRTAIRQVLKMIERREKWLAKRARKGREVGEQRTIVEIEVDPTSAEDAMVALGIAERGPDECGRERIYLQPWAIDAALDRHGDHSRQTMRSYLITHALRDPDAFFAPSAGDTP